MENKHKILLVDSDDFLTEMYSLKLKEVGNDVVVLNKIEGDFVEKVLEIKPDLISLNAMMPKVERFHFLKILKGDKRTSYIPVIILTNLGQKSNIREGISYGAVDYIIMASVYPKELVDAYVSYLNDSVNYVKKYPEYLKKKFLGIF